MCVVLVLIIIIQLCLFWRLGLWLRRFCFFLVNKQHLITPHVTIRTKTINWCKFFGKIDWPFSSLIKRLSYLHPLFPFSGRRLTCPPRTPNWCTYIRVRPGAHLKTELASWFQALKCVAGVGGIVCIVAVPVVGVEEDSIHRRGNVLRWVPLKGDGVGGAGTDPGILRTTGHWKQARGSDSWNYFEMNWNWFILIRLWINL